MIRLPFIHAPRDKSADKASLIFSDYCRNELERRRDSDADLDESRFEAAVKLAIEKLETLEQSKDRA